MHSNTFSDMIEQFIGGSFKDVTRVASINSKLWTELFDLNSDNLIHEIEKFEKVVETIKEAIKYKNKNTLENIFTSAGQKRRMML